MSRSIRVYQYHVELPSFLCRLCQVKPCMSQKATSDERRVSSWALFTEQLMCRKGDECDRLLDHPPSILQVQLKLIKIVVLICGSKFYFITYVSCPPSNELCEMHLASAPFSANNPATLFGMTYSKWIRLQKTFSDFLLSSSSLVDQDLGWEYKVHQTYSCLNTDTHSQLTG